MVEVRFKFQSRYKRAVYQPGQTESVEEAWAERVVSHGLATYVGDSAPTPLKPVGPPVATLPEPTPVPAPVEPVQPAPVATPAPTPTPAPTETPASVASVVPVTPVAPVTPSGSTKKKKKKR